MIKIFSKNRDRVIQMRDMVNWRMLPFRFFRNGPVLLSKSSIDVISVQFFRAQANCPVAWISDVKMSVFCPTFRKIHVCLVWLVTDSKDDRFYRRCIGRSNIF
jgi:hypothetical protein